MGDVETDSQGRERREQQQPSQWVEALTRLPDAPIPASHLARICGVDLRTVHQWVDSGQLPHFRTPGRHLRFRALDVVSFLDIAGYPGLPQACTPSVLVLGIERGAHEPQYFWTDSPYLALVHAAQRGFRAIVIDSGLVNVTDQTAYFDAFCAACPGAQLILAGPNGHPTPGVQRVADLRQAFTLLS